MDTKVSTHEKGIQGEEKACSYLLRSGYTIIERNFRMQGGEIDIIALKDDFIIFVEVKWLPHGSPEMLSHVLNLRKQQKIIKTAKFYLQKHREYNSRYIRFDVLAIDVPELPPVHHIENAFGE